MKEFYNAGLIKRVQGRDADGNWNKEVAYIFTEKRSVKLSKFENRKICDI